ARPACDERARAGAGASLPPSARQWRRGRSRGREEEEEEEDEERWNRAARAPGVGPRGCLCSRRQPALPCGPPRNHYGDGDEPGKLHDSADCGQSAPQLPLDGPGQDRCMRIIPFARRRPRANLTATGS
ncbi:unnamed protein product, partial [Prorocentrum cordatum]